MKVSLVNTFDLEGGAARAAHRLHNGLLELGVDSKYFVQRKYSYENKIFSPSSRLSRAMSSIRMGLSSFPLYFYPHREAKTFSTGLMTDNQILKLLRTSDIINLHWFSSGLLSIETLSKINKPIILTLHDSWLLTGGCHVPGECKKFLYSCGKCPQLGSNRSMDLSRLILSRKKRSWKGKYFTIVTDGKWLAESTENSPLFKGCNIETINPGMDLDKFKPLNKQFCREILGIPNDCFLILFGAMSIQDENKGYKYLVTALNLLEEEFYNSLRLLVFGNSKSNICCETRIPIKNVGRLQDDYSLSLVYSAADVMVVPSIQEAFGQTASESLACGTPVVAFDTTGLKDSIEHKVNGYLATPFDAADLANGIKWVLKDKYRWNDLSKNAREKAEKCFSINTYANKYLSVYEKAIEMHLSGRTR